jgi:hypothetical protein
MRLETWPAPPGDRIPNYPPFAVLIYHDVGAAKERPGRRRRPGGRPAVAVEHRPMNGRAGGGLR